MTPIGGASVRMKKLPAPPVPVITAEDPSQILGGFLLSCLQPAIDFIFYDPYLLVIAHSVAHRSFRCSRLDRSSLQRHSLALGSKGASVSYSRESAATWAPSGFMELRRSLSPAMWSRALPGGHPGLPTPPLRRFCAPRAPFPPGPPQ